MFSNNKNQNNPGGNNNQNSQAGLDKVPVRTMQDDLNYLKNPNASREEFINIGERNFTPEEKSDSPFLNASVDAYSPNIQPAQNQPSKPQSFQPQPAQPQTVPRPASNVPSALPVSPAPVRNNPIENEKEEFLRSLAEKREKERGEAVKGIGSDQDEIPRSRSNKMIFIVGGAIIFILLLAGGGYYFWNALGKNNAPNTSPSNANLASQTPADQNSQNSNNTETQNQDTNTNQEVPVQTQFSLTNPNILSISVDNPGAQDINQLLVKTATDIRSQQISAPLEFMVTDKNNNPVSFSNFAAQAGIKLPSPVLNALGDDFSVYFFQDNGNMRLGLAVSLKNTSDSSIKSLLLAEEKNLYADLAPLYIETVPPAPAKITFLNGAYETYGIRYINIDQKMTTSVDYSVGKSQIIFGTSKQAMRAILDKISQETGNTN